MLVMSKLTWMLALLGLATSACGAVGTAPTADAAPTFDADPLAPDADPPVPTVDADTTPDATPPAVVEIYGPANFTGGVCSATGIFGFTIDGGPPSGTFTWTSDGGTGDLYPFESDGAQPLDGAGAATVELSACTPLAGSQIISIDVTIDGDTSSDTFVVTINGAAA